MNHEQKKVANKMLARAGASLQKIVVDDVVAIPVPAVDRAKLDSNLLLCRVMTLTKTQCKLATTTGYLPGHAQFGHVKKVSYLILSHLIFISSHHITSHLISSHLDVKVDITFDQVPHLTVWNHSR